MRIIARQQDTVDGKEYTMSLVIDTVANTRSVIIETGSTAGQIAESLPYMANGSISLSSEEPINTALPLHLELFDFTPRKKRFKGRFADMEYRCEYMARMHYASHSMDDKTNLSKVKPKEETLIAMGFKRKGGLKAKAIEFACKCRLYSLNNNVTVFVDAKTGQCFSSIDKEGYIPFDNMQTLKALLTFHGYIVTIPLPQHQEKE